ncbi:signal peptidase I SipW [Bacillus sp. NPDC077027]|uniref:signal peptidase I SipW n=1 Tax=Bacillus sp. NPDC077027 TaxID=3390548 RepID=UPI003D02AA64
MKRILNMTSSIMYAIIFTIMIALIIIVLSSRTSGGEPQIFGYQLKQVLSGSMEPEFSTGSLIVVKKLTSLDTLKVGDIITFQTNQDKEQSFVTHRIVSIKGEGKDKTFETKGDHNMYIDGTVVKGSQIFAEYTGVNIPYAGKFLSYAGTSAGTALLLIIPGVLLLIYSLVNFMGVAKQRNRSTELHITEKQV